MHIICALIHNATSCFYGTLTGNYFGQQPPLIIPENAFLMRFKTFFQKVF